MKAVSWLMVVAACVLVAAGLGYYKYRQIQAAMAFGASFPEPVEAVEAAIVREELWQPTTAVTGDVRAIQTVDVSTELAGRIVEVGFAPGASVSQGQLLVRLDTSEERAQRAAAEAAAELARLALSRNERLMRSGAAAEEARDTARAQFNGAMAAVARLQAVIDKKTLRAPFDALAGLHQLEPGQYLDSGSVVTHLVGTGDEVWIDFTLPQQHAALDIGGMVSVTVSSAVQEQVFPARIIARDAFLNERSRNISFRALMDNSQRGLYPGMLVSVIVPVGEPRNATLVPATAVRRDAFGAHVYLLQPAEEGAAGPERALKRDVTLGPQRGGMRVIASGLEPGRRVAANGSFKLRDGALANSRLGAPPAEQSVPDLARD